MIWETLLKQHHFSMLNNIRWNLWVMALVNSYGLNNRDQMGNGSDLMLKSWRKRNRHTVLQYNSGPNTITIHTTSVPHQSKETSSSITTEKNSSTKVDDGGSQENLSISCPVSTSRTRSPKRVTGAQLSLLVPMARGTTMF